MKEQEAPSIDKLCTMYICRCYSHFLRRIQRKQDKNRLEVLAATTLTTAKCTKHAGKMFCPKF